MRKISLILVIFLLSAPAWADVNITIEPNAAGDPCSYDIMYEVTGDDATVGVRAFALDIYVVPNANDVNIVDVNDFHAGESDVATARGYGIFPSSFASEIDPEDPDWDDSGYNPVGDEQDYPDDTLGGLDTNGITVEMGALYVESPNKPLTSGKLLEIVLENDDWMQICVELNEIRGTIVLEDTNTPATTNLPYCRDNDPDCLIGGNAGLLEYSDWETWGKPDCWCYAQQCRGDADGARTGPYWVAIPDLGVLIAAYGKRDPQLALVPNGICADFDHKRTGPYRVAIPDLGILINYYGQRIVPDCETVDPPNYPTLYTGPYDHWTN